MTDRQFAEVIARAMIMVLRAINGRYGLQIVIISGGEKKRILDAARGEDSPCARVFRECLEE